MKRFFIISVIYVLTSSAAFGWGRPGHSTIAYIAESHLTPSARKQINEYLHGNRLTSVASLNDAFKNRMKVDMGAEFPVSGDPRINTLPHTFESGMDFQATRVVNDNGRYVKNCVWFIDEYSRNLKANARNMDDSTRFAQIASIVHLVGDMHCPEHIRYYSTKEGEGDMTIGYFNVIFKGEPLRYHTLWDDKIIVETRNWSFSDLAFLIDRASKKEIKAITAGDVWDWAHDCALCSWPVHDVKPGQELSVMYVYQHQALVDSQISKAGYRLAAILNEIFN